MNKIIQKSIFVLVAMLLIGDYSYCGSIIGTNLLDLAGGVVNMFYDLQIKNDKSVTLSIGYQNVSLSDFDYSVAGLGASYKIFINKTDTIGWYYGPVASIMYFTGTHKYEDIVWVGYNYYFVLREETGSGVF